MTPYEGPHVGHGGAGGSGAMRKREAHPASVSVREDGQAAGEAGEGEWVAGVPEAGAKSEHGALLLHLCFTVMSLVCESKVQIASVIEGRSCPVSPGVGTQTWLANSANCRDSRSRAGPGRRGLTGPDLQTAADTRHGASGQPGRTYCRSQNVCDGEIGSVFWFLLFSLENLSLYFAHG